MDTMQYDREIHKPSSYACPKARRFFQQILSGVEYCHQCMVSASGYPKLSYFPRIPKAPLAPQTGDPPRPEAREPALGLELDRLSAAAKLPDRRGEPLSLRPFEACENRGFRPLEHDAPHPFS